MEGGAAFVRWMRIAQYRIGAMPLSATATSEGLGRYPVVPEVNR